MVASRTEALAATRRTRRTIVRLLAPLVVALCALGLLTSSAFADGDPASDYLLNQQTFMVAESVKAPTAAQRQLRDVVKAANEHGFKIRVAVIAGPYDLGAITQLWKKPETYARFLGIELSLAYKGRLVVAMPNGLGFYWDGHSGTAEYETLSSIKLGTGAAELASATGAVEHLASADGVSLSGAPASHASGGGGKGESDLVLILIAAAVLAIALAFSLRYVEHRRRPRSAERASEGAAKPSIATAGNAVAATVAPALGGSGGSPGGSGGSPGGSGGSPGGSGGSLGGRGRSGAPVSTPTGKRGWGMTPWLRVALPAFVLVLVVGGGAAILALSKRSTPRGAPAQSSAVVGTPFIWPAGKRPAPEFHLTSQYGKPISLSQYRGRPVFVTFIDPTCRNLCPLEAKVLNEIDGKLPAGRRPAILAVSVNVYSDSHADLMEDFSRWKLVPQWHWAVGKLASLESVWKRYYAEVEVSTKKIAGVTAHYITHSEMAYLIDGKGDERALFSWPFTAKDVERTLSKIAA
jgi:cytochrome oxidase Cu insertion factor (SCO1/SenC/PrrC family)